MSGQSGPTEGEIKNKVDVLKVRVEELDRNYFSLRDLEWRITLQFLSGYAAVGLGYHALQSRTDTRDLLLSLWCLILVLLLHRWYLFFSDHIRQRLRYVRQRKREYVGRLHVLVSENQHPSELSDKDYTLSRPHTWAFETQLWVHRLAVFTVGAYILKTAL